MEMEFQLRCGFLSEEKRWEREVGVGLIMHGAILNRHWDPGFILWAGEACPRLPSVEAARSLDSHPVPPPADHILCSLLVLQAGHTFGLGLSWLWLGPLRSAPTLSCARLLLMSGLEGVAEAGAGLEFGGPPSALPTVATAL